MRRRLSWAICFVAVLVATVATGDRTGKRKPAAESAAKKAAKPAPADAAPVSWLERATAHADKVKDEAKRHRIYEDIAQTYAAVGDVGRAKGIADRVADPEKKNDLLRVVAFLTAFKRHGETATRFAQSLDDPGTRARALRSISLAYAMLQDYPAAEKVVALIDDPAVVSEAWTGIAGRQANNGHYDAALKSSAKIVIRNDKDKKDLEKLRREIAECKASGRKSGPPPRDGPYLDGVRYLAGAFSLEGLDPKELKGSDPLDALLSRAKNEVDKSAACLRVAWYCHKANKAAECRRAMDQALDHARKINVASQRAMQLVRIADLALEAGDVARAKQLAGETMKVVGSSDEVPGHREISDLFRGFGAFTSGPLVIAVLARCGEIDGAITCIGLMKSDSIDSSGFGWRNWAAFCTIDGNLQEVEKRFAGLPSEEAKAYVCMGVFDGLQDQQRRGAKPPSRQAAESPAKTPAKPRPAVTISKEITYITSPLRKDGTVDYLAALNQRCSQGVTPENNAVVSLLQAIGPAEIDKKCRERFFKMLGIPPLPEKGPYLESYDTYFERKNPGATASGATASGKRQQPDVSEKAWDEFRRIMERPWSKTEFPMAATWIEENQRQIDAVVAATKRPRFYVPLVAIPGKPETLLNVLFTPMLRPSRSAARILSARAMYRLGAGNGEEAWKDLMACHRLARQMSQGPWLVDTLTAMAIEGIAVHADAVLAHEGKLSAEQRRRFAAEFRQLPPLGKISGQINWGERFLYLDLLESLAKEGPKELETLLGDFGLGEGKSAWLAKPPASLLIDWNETMRRVNERFDRIVAALSKPTYKERASAMAALQRDLKTMSKEAESVQANLRSAKPSGSLRLAVSRATAEALVSDCVSVDLAAMNAEERGTAYREMVPVLFGLAAYRADHAAYPVELAALVPKHLPAIPADPFSGGPFRYKREGAGYVLYSVGPNGTDDGGRNYMDEPDSEKNRGCDDIAIHVPVRSEK